MKTQVELESLQEQLRVRKEKQYQLLEKLQGQEEAKRQAEDQVCVSVKTGNGGLSSMSNGSCKLSGKLRLIVERAGVLMCCWPC